MNGPEEVVCQIHGTVMNYHEEGWYGCSKCTNAVSVKRLN